MMGLVFPSYDGFTPLFPQYTTPKGEMPPVYAWRVWTNPTTSISSSVANPRPLSDIPASVLAICWYASPPGFVPERKTLDYDNARPYTFYLPDGSTRVNSTSMSNQAYQSLLTNFLAAQSYPP
jgi:hypothetical protein